MDIRDAVAARATEEGFALDAAQESLLAELAAFADRRDRDGDGPVGWFVHGPAGRGKTWLVQAVFDAVPAERKRRVHFHSFFQELQRRFGAHASTRAAIDATVEELLDGAQWFLFDELHLHDPAAAALLNHLLRGIAVRGVPTLITSNYAPDGLLSNPVYHHVFAPGLAVLRERFEVRTVDGGVDYRREAPRRAEGFAAGRWIVGERGDVEAAGLLPPADGEREEVPTGSYRFTALAVRDDEVWFGFDDLLETGTTPQDYLGWTTTFRRWVLVDAPPLVEVSAGARQRFVALVDVLSDADLPLTVQSRVDRAAFVDVPDAPVDLFRAASRLALLSD